MYLYIDEEFIGALSRVSDSALKKGGLSMLGSVNFLAMSLKKAQEDISTSGNEEVNGGEEAEDGNGDKAE